MLPITQFASDQNLLATPLWPKQSEILESFWRGNYGLAVWALGRRSGKTLMSAVAATYAACMLADEYKKHVRPGEKFYIVSVANTIDQAKIALQGVKDLINGSPILKPLIVRETSDTLELSNGAVFRALPASSRSGRGMACPLLIFDELAHAIDSEGNAAGSSLYQALSPSVAQFGELGKILLLSSPWIQSGIFYVLFKQANSGQFPQMQVVNLPTWEVNPTISRDWLEQEKARDPEMFRVEYGAEFSQSLAAFLEPDLIDMAVNPSRSILLNIDKYQGKYYLALDPAKGNRDDYTACIGHFDGDRLVIDRFHEFKPSFSPDGKKTQVSIEEVEKWILEMHAIYRFWEVVLDQYNSQSTIQRLSSKLKIKELTWTVPTKTEAFSKLRELFNAGKIELYPHQKAIAQLKGLIVQYRQNGTWNVTGGSGAGVDDYCSVLAAIALNSGKSQYTGMPILFGGDPIPPTRSAFEGWRPLT